jgi:DNA-binding NarL/FixJ family response regulator
MNRRTNSWQRRIASGAVDFCPDAQRRVMKTPKGLRIDPAQVLSPYARLTGREVDVLIQMGYGRTVERCAQELGLKASTIDNYKASLMKKLNLHKSVDIVRLALREGIVST